MLFQWVRFLSHLLHFWPSRFDHCYGWYIIRFLLNSPQKIDGIQIPKNNIITEFILTVLNINILQIAKELLLDRLRLFLDIILMQQQSRQEYSIVYTQTYHRFQIHLKVIQKIITNQLWVGKRTFPSILIYQISKFVFRNPIRLKESVYTNSMDKTIKLNDKCLLKLPDEGTKQHNIEQKHKNQQRSAFLTFYKQWKAVDVSHCSYAQVILKGRFFLNFLSNIKITVGRQQQLQIDAIANYDAFQKNEKERSRWFTLISDNRNIVCKQFEEILQYQKDKMINQVVIRSFTSLMAKNIVAVRVQTNYSTQQIGSQGKYLYIQNNSHLPLTNNQQQQTNSHHPWLQIVNGQWRLGTSNKGIQLYKQQGYPLKRCKRWLVNKKLQYYIQDDVWVYNH